jgi:hypothetical protein
MNKPNYNRSTLFNNADVSEMIGRIDKLTPETQNHWGKMNVTQMLAHCNKSLETAMGENNIPRIFIGKIFGPFLKRTVLSEKPFGKNSPTDKSYIFKGPLDFEVEKQKLKSSLHKFLEGGLTKCTQYPHPFFGKFTPEEWGIFTWKHLDHHLRQFGE